MIPTGAPSLSLSMRGGDAARALLAGVARQVVEKYDADPARVDEALGWAAFGGQDAVVKLLTARATLAGIDGALAMAASTRSAVSLALIDLDDFKTVNDTLGHKAGDELLRVTSARLAAVLRRNDSLARSSRPLSRPSRSSSPSRSASINRLSPR